MAITIEDVLCRRTRALLLEHVETIAQAAKVGELMATELGWDEQELQDQIKQFVTVASMRGANAGLFNEGVTQ